MNDSEDSALSVPPFVAGVKCRCPRCGKGAVFQGFLDIRPACGSCGLDFSEVDTGDGPAVFVIFVVSFVVVALAAWVEIAFMPPIWVHMLLWISAIILLSLGLLRPFKATLIALQYKHRAREGRLDG